MRVTGAGEEQVVRLRGRFTPGRIGNPAGRPRGSRNRTSVLCGELLGASAADIMDRVVKAAKKGEPIALKLCVDRLLPVRAARDRAVELGQLPAMESAADLVQAAGAVIERAAAGDITLSEAKEFMALLEVQRRAIETADLVVRIEALEASGAMAGASPQLAARVRRVLDERLRKEGPRDLD